MNFLLLANLNFNDLTFNEVILEETLDIIISKSHTTRPWISSAVQNFCSSNNMPIHQWIKEEAPAPPKVKKKNNAWWFSGISIDTHEATITKQSIIKIQYIDFLCWVSQIATNIYTVFLFRIVLFFFIFNSNIPSSGDIQTIQSRTFRYLCVLLILHAKR